MVMRRDLTFRRVLVRNTDLDKALPNNASHRTHFSSTSPAVPTTLRTLSHPIGPLRSCVLSSTERLYVAKADKMRSKWDEDTSAKARNDGGGNSTSAWSSISTL